MRVSKKFVICACAAAAGLLLISVLTITPSAGVEMRFLGYTNSNGTVFARVAMTNHLDEPIEYFGTNTQNVGHVLLSAPNRARLMGSLRFAETTSLNKDDGFVFKIEISKEFMTDDWLTNGIILSVPYAAKQSFTQKFLDTAAMWLYPRRQRRTLKQVEITLPHGVAVESPFEAGVSK